MAKDLRSYLRQLLEQRPDDVVVVDREVDPVHEVTALVERFERERRYPVVLCRRVKGSELPLIINLGASYDRLALAMGVRDVRELEQLLAERELKPRPPVEIPKAEAPVKEVVWTGPEVDLTRLPILQHNELDAGKYIDAAACLMKQRGTGVYNVGL